MDSVNRLANATLVVLGHGSAGAPDAANAVLAHTDSIADQHLFAAVHPAFLRQPPFARDVLDTLRGDVVIVPHLAAAGYIATDVAPRELALDGALTDRDGKRIHYAEPVGTHPRLADVAAGAVAETLSQFGLDPMQTAAVVVGHGTDRDPASGEATRALAAAIAAHHPVAECIGVLLEIAPRVDDWRDLTSAPSVIFVPFLFSSGFHGRDDIPARLGLPPTHAVDGPAAGPFETGSRQVFLCPPLGTLPALTEVIVARARQILD